MEYGQECIGVDTVVESKSGQSGLGCTLSLRMDTRRERESGMVRQRARVSVHRKRRKIHTFTHVFLTTFVIATFLLQHCCSLQRKTKEVNIPTPDGALLHNIVCGDLCICHSCRGRISCRSGNCAPNKAIVPGETNNGTSIVVDTARTRLGIVGRRGSRSESLNVVKETLLRRDP